MRYSIKPFQEKKKIILLSIGFYLILAGCGLFPTDMKPLTPTSKILYINRGATFTGEDGNLFIRTFNHNHYEFIDDYGVLRNEMTAGISVILDDQKETLRYFLVYAEEIIIYYSCKIHILRFGGNGGRGFLEVDVTSVK